MSRITRTLAVSAALAAGIALAAPVAHANIYLDVVNMTTTDYSSAYVANVAPGSESFTLDVYALITDTNPSTSVDELKAVAANFYVASSSLKGDVNFGSWDSLTVTGSNSSEGTLFTTAYGGALGLGGSGTLVTTTTAWWNPTLVSNPLGGSAGSLYAPPNGSEPVGAEYLLGTLTVTFTGYVLPSFSTTASFASQAPVKLGTHTDPFSFQDSSGTYTVFGSASNVGNGGNGNLLYSMSGAGLNFVFTGTGAAPSYYAAQANLSALALSSTRVMAGGTLSASDSLSNTAYSTGGTMQQDSLANWKVGGSGGFSSQSGTNLAAGSSVAIGPLTYAAGATAGLTNITLTSSGTGANGTGVVTGSSSATVAVLDNRVVTASEPTIPTIHVGQSFSQSITLSTSGADNAYTRVTVGNAGPDGNGVSVSGGANPVFNGPGVTDTRTISGTPTAAGLVSGTVVLPTTGEGLPGESPVNVSVNYTVPVFSGSANWTGGSAGSWGAGANWSDVTNAAVHGAPGVWGIAGDAATLGPGGGAIALDGANPVLAALTFSSSAGYTLSAGSGGSLTLASAGGPLVSVLSGSHSIAAPVVLADAATVNTSLGTQLSITGGIGESSPGTPLAKTGPGTLFIGGNNSYSGGTTIGGGTLALGGTLAGGAAIAYGATLAGSGTLGGNIDGQSGSTIAATGNLVLGDSTSYTGFNQAGTLAVGGNAVTLNSAAFANLGALTSLSGGTLAAPNGVSLGVGSNLVGSGVVQGKVAAGYGSTINATGNLALGDSTSPVGFVSDGELYTGANTVTLSSSNAAGNKNAVALGSLTQIAGGNLVAPNGILLGGGDNLVTTDAGGTVSGGTAARFLNQGNVQGPSSASSNWLTFNLLFKGGTGQTSGRIDFAGGFATGDSPGVNTQYDTAELGGSGTEFDIGGTMPGNTNNNYGQLNIATDPNDASNHGNLALLPNASFSLVDWDGFVPTPGETFTVLTWDGTLSGTASLSVDPAFAAEGITMVPQWNANSLVVEAVPEPSTLAIVAAISIVLVVCARTRRGAR